MDLHVYRNSQDRWHDLRSAARERGAVLALNAVTLDELVERAIDEIGDGTRAKARDYIGGQHIGDRVLSGNESSGSMLSENESSANVLSGNLLSPNVVAGFS